MAQKYVALLRGINVGGNNKVEMSKLKKIFEQVGCEDVVTYLNTGNVIFKPSLDSSNLQSKLETAIEAEFGLSIKVLLKSYAEFARVINALPAGWANNKEVKSDVLFLWDEINSPDIMQQLTLREGIDSGLYVDGALLWSVERTNAAKSALVKLPGTKLYKKMTVRNVNTTHKIWELLSVQ